MRNKSTTSISTVMLALSVATTAASASCVCRSWLECNPLRHSPPFAQHSASQVFRTWTLPHESLSLPMTSLRCLLARYLILSLSSTHPGHAALRSLIERILFQLTL